MFRTSRSQHRRIEALLRSERPTPPDELVRSLSRRIGTRPTGVRPTGVPRRALTVALTAVMLVALASVGGISYAGNAVKDAVGVVKSAVSPSGGKSSIAVLGINSGGDQYRPGYGWGDPKHNHSGPPGLELRAGKPIRVHRTKDHKAWLVSFTIVLDEQATLRISVVNAAGKKLLLTQTKGSKVGTSIRGPQTKTIRYRVLVPRAMTITLRIPAKLLKAGKNYEVRIRATDPDGNTSVLTVLFVP